MAVVNTAAVMLLLVCAWSALQVLVLSGISHDRSQTLLYERFRGELAGLTAPIAAPVQPGDPVALLEVPAVGLEEVVVEGTGSRDLLVGPGHRRDTVLPGQEGTSVIYGRGATYGAPFRDITDLAEGDAVELVTGLGELSMRVIGVRGDGDPLPPARADGAARITLVTAIGDGAFSAVAPEETVYVDIETSEGFTASAPGVYPLPEGEGEMGHDDTALPMIALCLALLTAISVGVVIARQRWSAVLVWVVASPVALAAAWLTTDTVMRLLPNLA